MLRSLPALLCLVTFLLSVSARAQALDPALAPVAERYSAAIGELKSKRKAQLGQHEAEYARQLDAAINASTDEAKKAVLKKERQDLSSGFLAPAKPAAFPAEASGARKTFLSGAGKAAFDYHTAKKKLDDVYLKELATISKQAKGKNSALTGQIAAEKRRVTAEN